MLQIKKQQAIQTPAVRWQDWTNQQCSPNAARSHTAREQSPKDESESQHH